MAKRTNTIAQAILAVAAAARAEVNGELTAEQKAAAVNSAMDVLEDSDAITAVEYQQEAIDARLDAEAEAAAAEMVDEDNGEEN